MVPWTESFDQFLDRAHPEDRERVRDEIYRAMRERSDYHVHYRVHGPDEQLRSVAVRGRFIYRDIQPVRMVGVCFDLTDRQASAMEQAEQVVIDLEEMANRAAAQETPWKTREWIQRVKRLSIGRVRILPRRG